MAMNRVQFQKGLSLLDFLQRLCTEEQCATALESARWPDGFRCPQCDGFRLPLTIWFLAIYLISQAKTWLSALALSR